MSFLSAYVQGCMCAFSCVCVFVFVSAQGTKEQNKPEVAWQHKTLPNVNFEDAGTAGGGGRKRDRNGKQKKKGCCDCNTLLMLLGRACVKNIYYMIFMHVFIYVSMNACM